MKLALFLLSLSAFGQGIPFPGINPPASAPSYLFHETFEGSTACYGAIGSYCDNAWFYFQSVTANYATTPAPLQGSRSLFINGDAGGMGIANFTAQDTAWASTMFRTSSLVSANADVLSLRDASGNKLCTSYIWDTYLLVIAEGGTQQSSNISFSSSTTYYMKIKYVKGSGSNASCTAYYSTNGSSWSSITASTNGTGTAQASRIYILPGRPETTQIFDDIRVSTADINYP